MSIKLKLTKGLSYRGGVNGILKATKDKPFILVSTMEEAQAAVATGYFEIVGTQKQSKSPAGSKGSAIATKDLNKKEPPIGSNPTGSIPTDPTDPPAPTGNDAEKPPAGSMDETPPPQGDPSAETAVQIPYQEEQEGK